MPTSTTPFRARIVPAAFTAAMIAIMAAGPGTLLVPAATRLTQPMVCGAGERIEHQRVRYSYHGPGESSIEVNCVDPAGTSKSVLEKAMLTLFGLYFVVLFPVLALKTTPSPAGERSAYRAARRRERTVAPAADAESGESVAAMRELTEMADAGLINAQEFERKKAEILSRL